MKMNSLEIFRARIAAAILACLFSCDALATNGLNLTGYGTESSAMGGADVAVARDTMAVTINPAGIANIPRQGFDFYATPFHDTDGHSDRYGNDKQVSEKNGVIAGAAYVRSFLDSRLSAGLGLFVQGGTGYHYKNLETVFDTTDEAYSRLAISRFAPALAWRVNDHFIVGANLGINYAGIAEGLFPQTSVYNAQSPADSFFGLRFQGASGFGFNGKLGAQYKFNDRITLGLTYTSRASLPIRGGQLSLNEQSAGLGVVTYEKARLEGLNLPQEAAVGIAFKPFTPWLVSLQLKWIDWSGAIRTLTVEGTHPDNPNVPSSINLAQTLNFIDQYVYEAGTAYQLDPRTILRAGVNYGRRPLPNQNLTPIFAVTQALHLMAGFGRQISPQWEVSSALEYQPYRTVSYTNSSQPFGPAAKERNEGFLLHLMVSRRW